MTSVCKLGKSKTLDQLNRLFHLPPMPLLSLASLPFKMVRNFKKLLLCLVVVQTLSFVMHPVSISRGRALWSTTQQDVLTLSLEKPLGLVLEEVEEGEPKGVFVLEVSEEGAAAPHKEEIVGLQVATVMNEDVSNLIFDDVMDKLINAPSPVSIEFFKKLEEEKPEFEVGTEVTIEVLLEDGKKSSVQAKVGDNLRLVLLENDIEVYKGLKQKLGNCGGSGQCTFCAAEFVAEQGWEPRSDYENQKLKKKPNSRLTCLNNIQGPATIKL